MLAFGSLSFLHHLLPLFLLLWPLAHCLESDAARGEGVEEGSGSYNEEDDYEVKQMRDVDPELQDALRAHLAYSALPKVDFKGQSDTYELIFDYVVLLQVEKKKKRRSGEGDNDEADQSQDNPPQSSPSSQPLPSSKVIGYADFALAHILVESPAAKLGKDDDTAAAATGKNSTDQDSHPPPSSELQRAYVTRGLYRLSKPIIATQPPSDQEGMGGDQGKEESNGQGDDDNNENKDDASAAASPPTPLPILGIMAEEGGVDEKKDEEKMGLRLANGLVQFLRGASVMRPVVAGLLLPDPSNDNFAVDGGQQPPAAAPLENNGAKVEKEEESKRRKALCSLFAEVTKRVLVAGQPAEINGMPLFEIWPAEEAEKKDDEEKVEKSDSGVKQQAE